MAGGGTLCVKDPESKTVHFSSHNDTPSDFFKILTTGCTCLQTVPYGASQRTSGFSLANELG